LRYRDGLRKTREALESLLSRVKSREGEEFLRSLEKSLIAADIGVRTSQELVAGMRGKSVLSMGEREAGRLLREDLIAILKPYEKKLTVSSSSGPFVILVLGVNGVGKTTTIAKIAKKLKDQGRKVILAAGDTFRAAGIEQLVIWAQKAGVDVIKGAPGSDPSAVIFDSIKAAVFRKMDVVIADTAGRQHTKVDLMNELSKVKRAMGKALPGSPHETFLVLDAGTGQNTMSQAREFHSVLGLTGLIMTKLDGTARGGTIVSIVREFSLPVVYLGFGEGIDDLLEFRASDYVEALF